MYPAKKEKKAKTCPTNLNNYYLIMSEITEKERDTEEQCNAIENMSIQHLLFKWVKDDQKLTSLAFNDLNNASFIYL